MLTKDELFAAPVHRDPFGPEEPVSTAPKRKSGAPVERIAVEIKQHMPDLVPFLKELKTVFGGYSISHLKTPTFNYRRPT